MIRRIELTNFMSHASSELELADGLTVVVGPNNSGKSAIVAALQILSENPKSTYVTRHGADACSVKVTTSEGHVIAWKRGKTSVIYEINGTKYDRLKGNTPDELQQALRMPLVGKQNVHFGSQKFPLFLIDGSGKEAATFFAASSDAGKLVAMQKRHKQKVAAAEARQKAIDAEVGRTIGELAALEPTHGLETQVVIAEQRYAEIAASDVEIAALTRLLQELVAAQTSVHAARGVAHSLEKLREPPELTDCARLESNLAAQRQTAAELAASDAKRKALRELAGPPELVEVETLKKLSGDLKRYTAELSARKEQFEVFRQLQDVPVFAETAGAEAAVAGLKAAGAEARSKVADLERVAAALAGAEAALSGWSKANPTCPVCGAAVDHAALMLAASEGVHSHG